MRKAIMSTLKQFIQKNKVELMITIGALLLLYSFFGEYFFQFTEITELKQRLILLIVRLAGVILITVGFFIHSRRGKKNV